MPGYPLKFTYRIMSYCNSHACIEISISLAMHQNFNQSAPLYIEISINLPRHALKFQSICQNGYIRLRRWSNRRRRYVSWFFPSFFLVSQVISMWYLIVPNEFVINAELPVYKSDVTVIFFQVCTNHIICG